MPLNTTLVHKLLLYWFQEHARELPWREEREDLKLKDPNADKNPMVQDLKPGDRYLAGPKRDPYRVLVSEIMLQQTQVDRVIPKFQAFLKRWPTSQDFAKASLPDVLIFWKGLGYNRRARFLHQAIKTVVEQFHAQFPQTLEELLRLPGLGPYTASAVAVFALGQQHPVIDTNVKRILSRVWIGGEPSLVKQKELYELATQTIPKGMADPWHQALMDLGATICTSKNPQCEQCPLAETCLANQTAMKQGVKYRDVLVAAKKQQKKPSLPRFESTDRFFRGRVVDALREKSLHLDDLREWLDAHYNLCDRARYGQIIEGLVKDQLIELSGPFVRLKS